MQILSLNFLIYTFGGVWRPLEWSSTSTKVLYNIFTSVILILIYFLMITQLLDIIFVVNNIDDFATNALMFPTIVAVCFKGTIVVIRRKAIIRLIEALLKEPYKPQNEDEKAIQKKFDKFIKSCSIKYSFLATCSVTGVTVRSVINFMQGQLPYRVWLPYDSNKFIIFFLTSLQQIIAVIFVTIINIGTETLVFGLFLQTCAQFEIFENRLHKLIIKKIARHLKPTLALPTKKTVMSTYIRHHLSIYKLVIQI
ncbi:uncharacterized protein LOC109860214 [Pseudomyrmex gracilis]|uniref:uncharacterized protein LOC109860214 n=1 Tax=Pseudomyrmex gracilis TaxID=219809 RepID=UPI0009959097|nr:uncharacterized protein LOC109860214 [Pseudomyrmex gracilis]